MTSRSWPAPLLCAFWLTGCGSPVLMVVDPLLDAGLSVDRDDLRGEAEALTTALNADLQRDPQLRRLAVIVAVDRAPEQRLERIYYVVAAGKLAQSEDLAVLRTRVRSVLGDDKTFSVNTSQVEWPGGKRYRSKG